MVSRLRLIKEGYSKASYNMALDEVLLDSLMKGLSIPTLRFYGWEKPTVSTGYFQKAEKEIDLDLLIQRGGDFVKRPTGGRAVLHDNEVTFCLTIPAKGLGLWEVFREIHEAIGLGMRDAGIPAEVIPVTKVTGGREEKVRTAACFASPSRYELTINGKKAAGTAQKKVKDFMLIHGSIPLTSSYAFLFEVLRFPDEDSRVKAYEKSLTKMTSVFTETGRNFSGEKLIQHIVTGFSKRWKSEFVKEGLSDYEKNLTRELMESKYGFDSFKGK